MCKRWGGRSTGSESRIGEGELMAMRGRFGSEIGRIEMGGVEDRKGPRERSETEGLCNGECEGDPTRS